MYRLRILPIAIILLSTIRLAQAEEKKLAVTFDFTYMSKWMTKGREGYGQQGGIFGTIDIGLWDTGFGTAVTHQQAKASGYVNKERLNYKVYYGSKLFNGRNFKTDYKISWIYKEYPDEPRNVRNVQEWEFVFSWPEIIPNGLVPKYIAHYVYPAGSNYNNRSITGWVHRFGLGYKLNMLEIPEPFDISAEIAYTDGFGGKAVDHDWSYATFGISTKLKLSNNLSFVPALYHQISMDDSVSKRDVTYCKLSMRYKF